MDHDPCFCSIVQDDKETFQSEALIVSHKFQILRDELVLQYGYDRFRPNAGAGNSTQDQFTTKTRMQCDSESVFRRWRRRRKVRDLTEAEILFNNYLQFDLIQFIVTA